MITCKYCGARNVDNAGFCWFCGSLIDEPQFPTTVKPLENDLPHPSNLELDTRALYDENLNSETPTSARQSSQEFSNNQVSPQIMPQQPESQSPPHPQEQQFPQSPPEQQFTSRLTEHQSPPPSEQQFSQSSQKQQLPPRWKEQQFSSHPPEPQMSPRPSNPERDTRKEDDNYVPAPDFYPPRRQIEHSAPKPREQKRQSPPPERQNAQPKQQNTHENSYESAPYQEKPAKNTTRNRNALIGAVIATGVIAIVSLISAFMLSTSSKTTGSSKVVLEFLDSVVSGDARGAAAAIPSEVTQYYYDTRREMVSDINDRMDDWSDFLDDEFSHGWSVSYEIAETRSVSRNFREALIDDYHDYYNAEATDVKVVTVLITGEFDGGTDSVYADIYTICIDGEWYIEYGSLDAISKQLGYALGYICY